MHTLSVARHPSALTAALLLHLALPATAAVDTDPDGPYYQRVSAWVGADIYDNHGPTSGPITGNGWLLGPDGRVAVNGDYAGVMDWIPTQRPGSGLAAGMQGQTTARFQTQADQSLASEAWALASASAGLLQVRSNGSAVSQTRIWPNPFSQEWVWTRGTATAEMRGGFGVAMSRALAEEVNTGTAPLSLTIDLQGEIGPLAATGPDPSPFMPTVWLDVSVFHDYRLPETWSTQSLQIDTVGAFSRSITLQPSHGTLQRYPVGGDRTANCLETASMDPMFAWVPCSTYGGYMMALRTAGSGRASATASARWTVLDGVTEVYGDLAGWGRTPVDAALLTPVPEPGTAALWALGVTALGWRLRRRPGAAR
ncbi:PEP-CTERM sorting domain-containing protein [Ideonella sp. DXS22W]|uniref:PEP-CTERM sorting domain-containing protein n=1 Tax=Pseudaquabacterium inlustre TaxID=2984192 RepID=A0ABU9CHM7_9BURK